MSKWLIPFNKNKKNMYSKLSNTPVEIFKKSNLKITDDKIVTKRSPLLSNTDIVITKRTHLNTDSEALKRRQEQDVNKLTIKISKPENAIPVLLSEMQKEETNNCISMSKPIKDETTRFAKAELIWRNEEDLLDPSINSYIDGLYFIPKCHITLTQWKELKDDLTVLPTFHSSANGLSTCQTQRAVLYKEIDDEYLSVPCMYGIKKFGNISSNQTEFLDSRKTSENSKFKFKGSLRDNIQEEAVASVLNSAFENKRLGVIIMPCGYGKTPCTIYISSILSKRTAVFVPNNIINEQWYDEYTEFMPNLKIGKWCDGLCQVDAKFDVVIITIKSAICKMKSSREFMSKLMASFDLVIMDEVHHMGASTYSSLFDVIPYGRILGVSATPKRRDGLNCLFDWYIGPVLYQATREKMPWFHIIFMLYFDGKMFEHKYLDGLLKGKRNHIEMENDLVRDVIRNNYVLAQIISCAKENYSYYKNPISNNITKLPDRVLKLIGSYISLNDIRKTICRVSRNFCNKFNKRHIIVFVNRRTHAILLQKMLEKSNPEITSSCILGKMSAAQREHSKMCQVIFATVQCVTEAFNLPSLDTGISVISQSETEQLRGRLQRLAPFKFRPTLFDFVDMFSIFIKRAKYRQYQYQVEAGFTCYYKKLQSIT